MTLAHHEGRRLTVLPIGEEPKLRRAYLVFESGAYKYRSDPKTKNVIANLHKASISSLTSLA